MKNTYKTFYWISGAIAVIAILGGSITSPVFSSISQYTLETIGVKKTAFTSADEKIDELYYSVDKIQLSIDKLRNIFSSDNIDESKYQKTKHEILDRNIYEPLLSVVIYLNRLIMLLTSIIIFIAGVTLNIFYNKRGLRVRVEILEAEILQIKTG